MVPSNPSVRGDSHVRGGKGSPGKCQATPVHLAADNSSARQETRHRGGRHRVGTRLSAESAASEASRAGRRRHAAARPMDSASTGVARPWEAATADDRDRLEAGRSHHRPWRHEGDGGGAGSSSGGSGGSGGSGDSGDSGGAKAAAKYADAPAGSQIRDTRQPAIGGWDRSRRSGGGGARGEESCWEGGRRPTRVRRFCRRRCPGRVWPNEQPKRPPSERRRRRTVAAPAPCRQRRFGFRVKPTRCVVRAQTTGSQCRQVKYTIVCQCSCGYITQLSVNTFDTSAFLRVVGCSKRVREKKLKASSRKHPGLAKR